MFGGVKNILPILKKPFTHPLRHLVFYLIVITVVITLVGKNFNFAAQDRRQPPPGGGDVFIDQDFINRFTPARLYAEACVENDEGLLKCGLNYKEGEMLNLESMVYTHISILAKEAATMAFEQIANESLHDTYEKLPQEHRFSTENIEVELSGKRVLAEGNNTIYAYTALVTLQIPRAEFEEIFNAKTEIEELKTMNNQILNIAANATFELELPFERVLEPSNDLWNVRGINTKQSFGEMDTPFEFQLKNEIKLVNSQYIKNLKAILEPMGFILSNKPENLINNVEVNGRVNGKIKFSWDEEDDRVSYSTEELNFCPNECWIKVSQRAIIRGWKNPIPEYPTYGGFYYSLYAWDEARGTGYFNMSERRYGWNNDYKINKYSERKWGHDLSSDTVKSHYYNENELSTGINQPKIKYYNNTTTHRSMLKYVPSDEAYQKCRTYNGDVAAICVELRASKNYEVHKVKNNGQEQIERSGEGQSTRLETSYQFVDEKSYSGIYDDAQEEMLVTDTNVETWLNTRKDPYLNCNNDCGKFRYELLHPDLIQLIHYTANEDPEDFTLASPVFRDAPKHVVIIDALNKDDPSDRRMYNGFMEELSTPLYLLRRLGVSVQVESVDNANDWIILMDKLPKGALVIHIGHGGKSGNLNINMPDDALVSRRDTEEERRRRRLLYNAHNISRAKWRIISERKQSFYYVFESCYFGANYLPLGQKLIASISKGYPSYDKGNFGSLFGLGTNYFHITANETKNILYEAYLKALEKNNRSCSFKQERPSQYDDIRDPGDILDNLFEKLP